MVLPGNGSHIWGLAVSAKPDLALAPKNPKLTHSLCVHEPIADAAIDGLPCGRSCIKAPLYAILGAADVNEADISTHVAVDPRAVNRL
ncbi:hypothetical protein TNCV_640691 [Trichonephila clavipes]|nr:hypothetical protein TNCV_640691 [Trichonephila clavipes]